MASTAEDIINALEDPSGEIFFDSMIEPHDHDHDPLEKEVYFLNQRLEALMDLLVVVGLFKEPEYKLAFGNVNETMLKDGQPFEEFIAERRTKLLLLLRTAGLR